MQIYFWCTEHRLVARTSARRPAPRASARARPAPNMKPRPSWADSSDNRHWRELNDHTQASPSSGRARIAPTTSAHRRHSGAQRCIRRDACRPTFTRDLQIFDRIGCLSTSCYARMRTGPPGRAASVRKSTDLYDCERGLARTHEKSVTFVTANLPQTYLWLPSGYN